MIQALVDAAQGGCRGGNPALVDAGIDDIDQALVADVFVGCATCLLFLLCSTGGVRIRRPLMKRRSLRLVKASSGVS